MTNQKILDLLEIERECILRNNGQNCDRDCERCDLVQDPADLIEMYNAVIADYKRKVRNDRFEAREQEIWYNYINGCS